MFKAPDSAFTGVKTIEDIIKHADLAHSEGHRWARAFLPKLASDFDDKKDYDLKRVMRAMHIDNSKIIKLKNRMVADDEELQQLTESDREKELQNKCIVVSHNVYTLSALRVWDSRGIRMAKRIEIQDDKICPLCRIKNGELYDVEYLLRQDLPLNHDTHPHCRGSFIPVMGSITKHPGHVISAGVDENVATLVMYGCVVEDIPVEYKPFMEVFLKRIAPLPFKVKFDKKAEYDYRLSGNKLTINPRSADNEDPREIIARMKAKTIWPEFKGKFEKEYGALIQLGLVHPNRASQSWPELWENTYTEFKLNQLDEPYEVLWCKSNLAA